MQKMKRLLSIFLVVCMMVSILPAGALAIEITPKPENDTTVGQPFAPGTGGSNNFRIPGIVTLDNGTLIATSDARWNGAADAGGLDTIVSVSTDNGANWTYTFANYLGDNGNTWINTSSCIIDPAIGTDGTTAYMIADLFPAGFAINSARYAAQTGSTGFNAAGNLILRSDSENNLTFGEDGYQNGAKNATYGYYLENGKIYTTEGALVDGYTVDAYFNITGNDVNTNLFFSDSPFKPFPTDYLYLTTTTDGLNWSEPELLQLKDADEQTLLVGPGNGTYDASTGRMVFTAYDYTFGYQRACVIWRETDGTWHRTEDASINDWSSEASVVALNDGTLRCFYRDGYSVIRYTDFVWSEAADNYVRDPDATQVSTTASRRSNNQLSAIHYSETIDGKEAILVACAAYTGDRKDGHLYVFLVNDDNTMDLAYDYDIFPGQIETYAYNCISEMDDGNIALLYENASAAITYHVIDMDNVLIRDNDPSLSFEEFELLNGYTKTFTDHSGAYTEYELTENGASFVQVSLETGEAATDSAQLGSDNTYSGNVIEMADCLYTFTKGENDRWSASAKDGTVHLYPGNNGSAGYPNRASAYNNLSIFEGYEDGTFYIKSNDCDSSNHDASYLYFDRGARQWDRVSALGDNNTWKTNCSLRLYRPVEGAGSTEIPGYERVTELDAVGNGEYLVVAPGNDGKLYALYPNTATTNRFCQIAKVLGRTTKGYTEITFIGAGEGYVEALIGKTVYKMDVYNVDEIDVSIPVGTTKTYNEYSGQNANADTTALDKKVAAVTMENIPATNANGVTVDPVTELTDGKYVILNSRKNTLVTSESHLSNGQHNGLLLNGSKDGEIAEAAIWTITKVGDSYTLQAQNGKYMTISPANANVLDEKTVLRLAYDGSDWSIDKDGQYLNNYGGTSTDRAAGHGSYDAGSKFKIYRYTGEHHQKGGTMLTFTGVYPGATELLVGHTLYKINVTGEVHDVDLGVKESETFVIDGDHTGADLSGVDTSIVDVELDAVGYVGNVNPGYYVALSDCLFTFTKRDDGYYEISAITKEGTKVYLNHFSSGNNNPTIASPAGKIEVSMTKDNSYRFKLLAKNIGGDASDRTLHFHRECYAGSNDNDGEYPFWNRCGNDTSHACREFLYRPVKEGEESSTEIKGFVKVTKMDEIVDGGQYLIVNDTANATNDLYVLHPSTSTVKYDHVAKVENGENAKTHVTITARTTAGDTTMTLPGHYFDISVTKEYESERVKIRYWDEYAHDTNEAAFDKLPENAFDWVYCTEDNTSFWASPDNGVLANQFLTAKLGKEMSINEIKITQRWYSGHNYDCNGKIKQYVLWTRSDDDAEWVELKRGSTVDGTTTITLDKPVNATQVKLTATDTQGGKVMNVAEFEIFALVCKDGEHTLSEPVKDYHGDGSYDEVVYCSDCGKEMSRKEFDKFTISGASMTMANSLDMNFAFDKAYMTDWTGCYAIINGPAGEQKVMIDSVMKVASVFDVDSCYVTYTGIAAKEMIDDITVTIYNKNGVQISNTYTDSVRNQAMRNLANNVGKEDNLTELNNTMVVDMLNYGAEAQRLAGYKTDDLATAELTDAQKAFATQTIAFDDDMTCTDGFSYKANVKMVSNLQFMMAFSDIDPEKVYANVSFEKYDGTPKTVTIDGEDFVESGIFYYFTIEETVVADGRQIITCQIIDETSKEVVAEVHDSIASYASRTTSNTSLYEAIMKFSDSAKAYLMLKNNINP